MTAEAEVRTELSKVVIEDKCGGLDMSPYQDMPKVGGDCNGVNKHVDVDDDKEEEEKEQQNTNVNGKDDPDGSYVFVSRSDSANGDPIDRDLNAEGVNESHILPESKDIEGQFGELNAENGETVSAKDNCIAEDTEVTPDSSLVKLNVAGDDVLAQDQSGRAVVVSEQEWVNTEVKMEEQIEPDLAPNLEENRDSPNVVLEVGLCATPQHDDGKIEAEEQTANFKSTVVPEVGQCGTQQNDDGKLESEEETSNFKSTVVSEVGQCGMQQNGDGKIESEEQTASFKSTAELGEVRESQIAVSVFCELHDEEEKSEEQDNLELTADYKESEKAQVVVLEASECKSSLLDDSKVDSKEEADIESTTDLESSQGSNIMASEAIECKLPEAEVEKVIAEKQTELESRSEGNESLESQGITLESPKSESYLLDNGEEKLEEREKTDLRMEIKEKQESPLVVTDDIISAIDNGNKAEKLANETDVPLETENANEHVLDENKDSCHTSQVEDYSSLTKVLKESIDGSQNTTVLNGSYENAKNFPSPADCMRLRPVIEFESEKVEKLLSCPVEDTKLEIEIKNDTVTGDKTSNCNEVSSEIDIGLHTIDPEGKVTNLSCTNVNTESEVSNRVTDFECSQPLSVNGSDPEYHANGSLQNGSSADVKSESEVENSSSISGRDMPCNDAAVSQSEVLDGSVVNCGSALNCVPEGLDVQAVRDQVNSGDGDDFGNFTCQETKDTEWGHREKISTSLPEGSTADALDEQSADLEAVKRPFNFLIKIPRYDDETPREQIRHAQLQVDEKTQLRDVIQVEIQTIRGNCQQLHNNYAAAKSEERSARGLVKLKRQEIDSVQSVINKVMNAISVQEIDFRIHNMERMIQHETLPLKEEKQFIREIKQLKHLREQLSSNMGSQDEVHQRNQIEERLKILKKELDCLKDKVSKAEATAGAAEKKYNDESKKLKELHAQFRAADDIRQEAYTHLHNLRKQFYEKNTRFRMYKDDATAAYDFALSGDKMALHRLCVNQVETVMELWNKNDEFRKEYIRCNTRSTLRRFRTLDGRALGPDEVSPVLPNVTDERTDRSRSTPGKANSELPVSNREQEKKVSTVEGEETDGKSMAKVAEQMDQTVKAKKPVIPTLMNGSATVSSRDKTEEISEEEHKQSKEEQELARKEEELRKEEAAAKLKEQQRLEEKAKAKEALERKRRNAEKAQVKAEVRAQKEAEQKEKEREKRARKKDNKKAAAADAPDGNSSKGEGVPTSESTAVTTKESDIKESPSTTRRPPKPIQFTKQSKTKSIPPPLRNRGKRRMQQWIWVIVFALFLLALFLLSHMGFYSNLGHNLRMRNSGY